MAWFEQNEANNHEFVTQFELFPKSQVDKFGEQSEMSFLSEATKD